MPSALLLAASATFFVSCAADEKPAAGEAQVSVPRHVVAPVAAPLAAPVAAKPDDEDEVTGKSLYQRHCAGCHNDNGDGKGATILAQGKQARSFAQGGFAFGNTPEAIFKTITSGIPGSSLMQPFKSQMDDDERMLVAKYVLTLTPYKEAEAASDSIMIVGDRAVVAYGKLPALHDGGTESPRGLMVGLPGGMSFEYGIDNARLLAVRRGAFVDRTDWNERGGGVLKPLGKLVRETGIEDLEMVGTQPPSQRSWFMSSDSDMYSMMRFSVSATRVIGARAQIEMRPIEPTRGPAWAGQRVGRVVETLFQPTLSADTSFGRQIVIEPAGGIHPLDLRVLVAGWNAGELVEWKLDSQGHYESGWLVLRRGDEFECRHVHTEQGLEQEAGLDLSPRVDRKGAGELCATFVHTGASRGAFTMTIVTVFVGSWDESTLTSWSSELMR